MPLPQATPLLAAALLAAGLAPGCRGGDPPREPGVIRIALVDEPPILDTPRSTDSVSHFVLGHVMEGLTRVGKSGEIMPGIAERWELSEKGAVFHLREALWSDGVPVRAQDFVFGWRKAVEPKTASEYAFIIFPVKNGEAISQGKLPSSALGVRAVDDRTLEVEFERPTATFLILTPFSTYLPVREDFYRAHEGRYFADTSDTISDGPFVIASWVHGASMTFEKNPRYWNAGSVHLQRIEIPYITSDSVTRYNLFKDGKIDQTALDRELLGRAQADRLRMKPFNDGSTWYLEYNHRTGRPTRNLHLRRAIRLVFDPREFVSKVIGIPGTIPATRLMPRWVKGVSGPFWLEYPEPQPRVDLDAARRELELARKELGPIPPLVYLTDDTPNAGRQAEYMQYLLRSRLGLDLRIDKQIFKQRLEKMTAGDFDICAAGWGPDYQDAMTFADLFTSWNENNRGRFIDPRYDAAVRRALATVDPKTRMDAMAEAEKVLIEEEGILPQYERALVWVHDPRLVGVTRHVTQPDPDYVFARFEP